MKRGWKVVTIVGWNTVDSPVVKGAERVYAVLSCGHERHARTRYALRETVRQPNDVAWKAAFDKTRCYECRRPITKSGEEGGKRE